MGRGASVSSGYASTRRGFAQSVVFPAIWRWHEPCSFPRDSNTGETMKSVLSLSILIAFTGATLRPAHADEELVPDCEPGVVERFPGACRNADLPGMSDEQLRVERDRLAASVPRERRESRRQHRIGSAKLVGGIAVTFVGSVLTGSLVGTPAWPIGAAVAVFGFGMAVQGEGNARRAIELGRKADDDAGRWGKIEELLAQRSVDRTGSDVGRGAATIGAAAPAGSPGAGQQGGGHAR